jgi:hypothetical protein
MMKRLFRSRVMLALALLGDVMLYAGPGPYDYSSASFDAALDLQARVTDDWLARDGVVGTAIGVDGTGHAVLKVYLTELGVALFPSFVAGVQIVPEVTGRFMALPAAENDAEIDPRRGFPRPVPIGVSAGHGSVTAGTIGARATDGLNTFALSNNHVFAANNEGRTGDNLLQPGVVDGGKDPDDVFGTLYDYEPIHFCGTLGCRLNKIDAAIALSSEDDLGTETPDGGYGSPRGTTQDAEIGLNVQKYGRTTGHTVGRVTGINATIDVGYRVGTARFEGQVVISGNGFSAGGDSGSLIVTKGLLLADRRPVGLLFAGTGTTTIANPIDLVLDRFNIRIDGN